MLIVFVTIGSRDLTFSVNRRSDSTDLIQHSRIMDNFVRILSLIFGILSLIIMAWYNNEEIPKGLPDDQLTSLKVSGASMDFLRFLVRTLAAVD